MTAGSPVLVARRRRRRGFSLVTTAVCLVAMIGALGLAIDVGRMYVVKNELQTYVDAAALAAVSTLDGTAAGLQRAESVAKTGPPGTPNRWSLGQKAITNVDVQFSNSSTSGWQARTAVGNAVGYRFMRISTSETMPLFLMPVLGVKNTSISAVAFAGQAKQGYCGNGCDPFSPDAPVPSNAATFGFQTQHVYTIKWAPPGQRKNNSPGMCEGDQLANTKLPGASSDRGYIDVGQGNGNSSLHDAIVNHDFSPSVALKIGDAINVVPGNKHVGPAIDERFDQDTDTTSNTWDEYRTRGTGNGRRLMHVPINNGNDIIIGFATFFMQKSTPRAVCMSNNDACCAEYVAPSAVLGSKWAAADPTDPTAFYRPKLFSGGF